MEAVIDMNSNRIINLAAPVGLNDAVRLTDVPLIVPMAANTIKGRNNVGTGQALDLSISQVVAMLPTFTDVTRGLVPQSDGSENFLKANGTWANPADATPGEAGLMSPADKAKLDSVATGATANDTDANLKARANHTGTQAQSTVVNLVSDLAGKATRIAFNPKDYGAVFDGTTDDTAAFVAASAAASAVGGVIRMPPGRTVIDNVDFNDNLKGFIGSGRDTVLIVKNRARTNGSSFLRFASTYCDVRDFSIIGDYSSASDCQWIDLVAAHYSSVRNVSMNGQARIFIESLNSDYVTIDGNYIHSTASLGLRMIVVDSTVYNEHVTVSNNVMTGSCQSHAVSFVKTSNSTAINNYIEATSIGGFGICFTYESNNSIMSHNTVKNTYLEAYQVTLADNCVVSNNFAQWADTHGADFGISLDSTLNCIVSSNIIVNSYKCGVAIAADWSASTQNQVKGNILIDSATRHWVATSGDPSASAYTAYNSIGVNSNNIFENNHIKLSTGKSIANIFAEFSLGGGGSTGNQSVTGFSWIGGTVVNGYLAIASTNFVDFNANGITPEHFGAVGNGVVNDTAAITKAASMADSLGYPLTFGPNTYLTDPLNITTNINITGVVGKTILQITRASRAASSKMFRYAGNGVVSGLAIDMNDPLFVNTYGLTAVGSNGATFRDNQVFGYFTYAMLMDHCTNFTVENPKVVSASVTNFRSFQVVRSGFSSSDATITGARLTGICSNHHMSIDDSDRIIVTDLKVNGDGNGAFGCSFTTSRNCHLRSSSFLNTGYEAFQMTQCTDCTMTDNFAQWGDAFGVDFGCSIDGTTNCTFSNNTFTNSYKAAVAIAADAADSVGNRVINNHAIDCAGRAYTAGATQVSACVYGSYTNAYNNNNNEWINNRAVNGATKAPKHIFGEFNGAAFCTNNMFRYFTYHGAGTPGSTPYVRIVGNGSKYWLDNMINYTPTVTATTPGATPFTYTINKAAYQPQGDCVLIRFDITIVNQNTSTGSMLVSLPADFQGPVFAGELIGREKVVSGIALHGEVSSDAVAVRAMSATGQYQADPIITNNRLTVAGYYQVV